MSLGIRTSLRALGALFICAGALHFAVPETYLRIMPSFLALHRELVYLSGLLEIAGGMGLLFERTRRAAGMGLVVLLLVVWPANFQMVFDARAADRPLWWEALLWARLPLQLVLIAWVWKVSQPRRPARLRPVSRNRL